MATRPRVSIMPSASPMLFSSVACRETTGGRCFQKFQGLTMKHAHCRAHKYSESPQRAVVAYGFLNQRFKFFARDRDPVRLRFAIPRVIAGDRASGHHGRSRGGAVTRAGDEQFFHIAPRK